MLLNYTHAEHAKLVTDTAMDKVWFDFIVAIQILTMVGINP